MSPCSAPPDNGPAFSINAETTAESCINCNARNAPARIADVPRSNAFSAAGPACSDASAFTARCATVASALAVNGSIAAAASRAWSRTSAASAAICTVALVSDKRRTNVA